MGFFKFLKRDDKRGSEAELDLPPAPPPLEGFEDDKNANLPEFPQISAPKEDDFKLDFPEYDKMPDMGKDEDMPEFPSLGDLDKEPAPNMNMPQAQKMVPAFSQAPPMPKPEQFRQPVASAQEPMPKQDYFDQAPEQHAEDLNQPSDRQENVEIPSPAHQPKHKWPDRTIKSGGSLYVRVDKFKTALDHISAIRGDLRKSEDDVIKLESLKHEKDKSFDKFKLSLDDLQKKLIFVDKTLFKGE